MATPRICGCPPNRHWGFNHDGRCLSCFYRATIAQAGVQRNLETTVHAAFGRSYRIEHQPDSEDCRACRLMIQSVQNAIRFGRPCYVDIVGLFHLKVMPDGRTLLVSQEDFFTA